MAGRPALRLIGPLLLLLVREGAPLLATTHRPVRQLRQLASGQHGAPRLRMQQEWEGQPRKQRRGEKAARPGPDYARNQICCYGCGAELQMEAEGTPGFVEPERYELKALHKQLRQTLCARCRAMTQGQILPAVVEGRLGIEADGAGLVTPEELRNQLVHLRERKALVVLLVDLSDVSGSFLPRVRDLIGPNPVLLVGTKADLLPRGTEQDKVLEWMACVLAARLNVLDAQLLSAKTGEGMGPAVKAVMQQRNGRDVYVMGAANVGKSLFIGALLDLLHAEQGGRMTRLPISSATPGTTLRTIPIDAFSGGSKLYDTPGVHLPHRLSAQLLPSELSSFAPRGRMKPYTVPPGDATQGASLFWGGVARVDIVQAPQALRLTFCGFGLRVTSSATADADAYHTREAGVSLTPPNDPESAAALGPLQLRKKVKLGLAQGRHTADIAVSGLGWVAVSCLPTLRASSPEEMQLEIDIWVPALVEVFLRPPMPVGGLPADTEEGNAEVTLADVRKAGAPGIGRYVPGEGNEESSRGRGGSGRGGRGDAYVGRGRGGGRSSRDPY